MKPANEPHQLKAPRHPMEDQLAELADQEDHRGRVAKLLGKVRPKKKPAVPVHPDVTHLLGLNRYELASVKRTLRKKRDQAARRALTRPAWEARAIGRKAEKAAKLGILFYTAETLMELLRDKDTARGRKASDPLHRVADLRADTINTVHRQSIGRVRQEALHVDGPEGDGAVVGDRPAPPAAPRRYQPTTARSAARKRSRSTVGDRRTSRALDLARTEAAHRQLVGARARDLERKGRKPPPPAPRRRRPHRAKVSA